MLDDFDDLLGSIPTQQHSAPPNALPVSPEGLPAQIKEAALAGLLGISSARVRTLARDGILVRVSPGTFDFSQSLRNYLARLRESAERAGRPSTGDELKQERTRLAREQADATALKNAALRGELVSRADTLREWQTVLRDVRAAMLAVPSRHAASQPHLTPHDIESLTTEIKRALEGLADGTD